MRTRLLGDPLALEAAGTGRVLVLGAVGLFLVVEAILVVDVFLNGNRRDREIAGERPFLPQCNLSKSCYQAHCYFIPDITYTSTEFHCFLNVIK